MADSRGEPEQPGDGAALHSGLVVRPTPSLARDPVATQNARSISNATSSGFTGSGPTFQQGERGAGFVGSDPSPCLASGGMAADEGSAGVRRVKLGSDPLFAASPRDRAAADLRARGALLDASKSMAAAGVAENDTRLLVR